ncbi:hypothetical protein GLW08_03320 [Pontibacillus yanchengensis]|uniref:Uncharacterized protein n=2 Tax=Pontibacillus yanchengensis TaxID=462910 RepID=A0ACC7VDY5_9BACI|nr:hypothetical protein [Pontibacillus yanchengensis]MYL52364.1 hypothetical protein [Pontibacillus yanchengensis]
MNCANLGLLQAYLDDELTREEKKEVMQHLETCESCRSYVQELQELDSLGSEKLGEANVEVDLEAAWNRFEHQFMNKHDQPSKTLNSQEKEISLKPKRGWDHMKKATKRWIMTGTAAATILGSLAIPQVQVAADNFLSIFRVNQVEMVKMTENDLREVERWVSRQEEGTMSLNGLGEIEVSNSNEHQSFDDGNEANQAGYNVPAISGYDIEHVSVEPTSKITFNLNVEKANALLTQIGAESTFDQNLDGKPFSVKVQDTISVHYESDGNSVSYTSIGTPEISVPKGASVNELRDTMLALPFIPENVKQQLESIDNLEHTLPIPYVQRNGSKSEEVSINGMKGYAVEEQGNTFLVWQSNEQIHMLESYAHDGENVTSKGQLVDMANQLNK